MVHFAQWKPPVLCGTAGGSICLVSCRWICIMFVIVFLWTLYLSFCPLVHFICDLIFYFNEWPGAEEWEPPKSDHIAWRALMCFCIPFGFLCWTILHVVTFPCFMHCVVVRALIVIYPIIMLSGVDDGEYLALHWIIWALLVAVYFGIMVLWFGRIDPKVDALTMIGYPNNSVNLTVRGNTLKTLKHRINRVYGGMQLVKYIKQALNEKFGEDVAAVIQMYAFPEWSQSVEK